MSLKQQNLFKIQSKWSEFFKSTSCILGHIKILMMHFFAFCLRKNEKYDATSDTSCLAAVKKEARLLGLRVTLAAILY